MPTIRLSDDIYDRLKRFADREMRSVTNATEYLLALQLGAANDKVDDLIKGVSENTPPPKNLKPMNPADMVFVPDVDKYFEKNNSGATPSKLVDNEHLEQPCCQHPTRPCKHWQWDTNTGEGYKNILSGRFREAD